MSIRKNQDTEPYWIDYEYLVTLSCPRGAKIRVLEIQKVRVERVEELNSAMRDRFQKNRRPPELS